MGLYINAITEFEKNKPVYSNGSDLWCLRTDAKNAALSPNQMRYKAVSAHKHRNSAKKLPNPALPNCRNALGSKRIPTAQLYSRQRSLQSRTTLLNGHIGRGGKERRWLAITERKNFRTLKNTRKTPAQHDLSVQTIFRTSRHKRGVKHWNWRYVFWLACCENSERKLPSRMCETPTAFRRSLQYFSNGRSCISAVVCSAATTLWHAPTRRTTCATRPLT